MKCDIANRFLCIMSIAIMFLIPAMGLTGTFRDNFNDGDAKGWKIEENGAGKWEIRNCGYHGANATSAESIALTGRNDWEVDSIEVRIRDIKGDWIAIVFRYQDLSNYDAWWLNIQGKTLEAWPKVKNYGGVVKAIGAVPFDPQKECKIKIIIDKNTFNVFFDGEKISSYTNDKFKTGRVGLLVWEGSATFDDVVIKGNNVSGVSPPEGPPQVVQILPPGRIITPGHIGHNDILEVRFRADSDVNSRFAIYDLGGFPVYAADENSHEILPNCLLRYTWNGRAYNQDDGELAEDGIYIYLLVVDGKASKGTFAIAR